MFLNLSTCGVLSAKRQTSDLDVIDSRPPSATRHMCCSLIRNPNKLNLLSWLLSTIVTNKKHCIKHLNCIICTERSSSQHIIIYAIYT